MHDEDFNAHLRDFGHTRSMDHLKIDKTTLEADIIGYMALEISYTGKETKEYDVYCFGILMLEVVCRRQPLDFKAIEPKNLVLLQSVWRAHEDRTFLRIEDPKLPQTCQSSKLEQGEDESIYVTQT